VKAALRSGVLVLNKSWAPINITIVKSAIGLVYTGKAKIVTHHDLKDKFKGKIMCSKYQTLGYLDWVKVSELLSEDHDLIHSVKCSHFKPYIIIQDTDKLPNYYIKLSRRALYDRDEGKCMYCGKVIMREHATIDHLLPKCRGGKTQWNNVVISCKGCNSKKGNKTLKECGMTLRKKPVKPAAYNFPFIYREEFKYWKDFIKGKEESVGEIDER